MKRIFKPQTIDQVIQENLEKLRRPGVLAVRPGFEIVGNQLTGKQAIVVTVNTKINKAGLSGKDILPEKIGKFPVDVRQATAYQRLRFNDPAAAYLVQGTGLRAEREPEWPNEREMPGGKTFDEPDSSNQKALMQSQESQTMTYQAFLEIQRKRKIDYSPTGVLPLVRMQVTANITAHVSPDAGYAALSKFLAGTQESLVVGMYDFTSGPLLKDFLASLKGGKTLQMVLDNPPPNKTRDQLDCETVEKLRSELGTQASIAWALSGKNSFVTVWMFPYAYHIKVIVRDGNTFWLSSGNLNNSNQPDLSLPPPIHKDRDWHLIIENEDLAKTFLSYLNYDYRSAAEEQVHDSEEIRKAIEEANAKKEMYVNPQPAEIVSVPESSFEAQTFYNVAVAVTPLLTPDKLADGQPQYLTKIIDLIKSAKKSVYIQLQYIQSSKGNGDFYEQLLQVIADKIAEGKDVKLIEHAEYGLKWAEKMKAEGVDLTANINLQPNVHNKGFVIDSEIVVVSSQNFSPSGVHDNRDAGVIIESPAIAQYFEKIFLSDWNLRSKPVLALSVGLEEETVSSGAEL